MRLRLWDGKPECVELKAPVPKTQCTRSSSQKYTLITRHPTLRKPSLSLGHPHRSPWPRSERLRGISKYGKRECLWFCPFLLPLLSHLRSAEREVTGWGPRVGDSLGAEILSSREHDSARLQLDPAWTLLWFDFPDPFQSVTQSFAPQVIFYTPGTHLPSSPARLRKPVVPENPQRKAPSFWIGGLST